MAFRKKIHKFTNRNFNGEQKVVCILSSLWHKEITSKLFNGAKKALLKNGIEEKNIISEEVAGSFELPLGGLWMIKKYRPDAVICLGCIIKGETPHFDFIAQSVSNGIMQLNLKHNIPVIFGVLTTKTFKQAKERSGGKHGNKGEEAALAALQMIELSEKTKLEL